MHDNDIQPAPPGMNYKSQLASRIMLVGSVGCGKTTFMQRAHGQAISYKKTQTSVYETGFFDTPGEYVEFTRFKHALQLTSYDADIILFIAASKDPRLKIPPGFTAFFNKPCVGVVSKIDISDADTIASVHDSLLTTGIDPEAIFEVSSYTGEGFDDLFAYLGKIEAAHPPPKRTM